MRYPVGNRREENHMFSGKETIKRTINISILTLILLSFSTQAFAQHQNFIQEDNFGNFLLNEMMNIEVVTDLSKDISLYEMPTAVTVFDPLDIQQPVQKTNPEISWTIMAINLTDDDLHKWGSATLGLYSPQPEKPDIREVSIPSHLDELMDVKGLKFENVRLIESILASDESLRGENTLMELIWQVSENIDVAIVGQHLLDMAYPDFVVSTTNDAETKRALYAKLTLRF
jgi:hypothetical protein